MENVMQNDLKSLDPADVQAGIDAMQRIAKMLRGFDALSEVLTSALPLVNARAELAAEVERLRAQVEGLTRAVNDADSRRFRAEMAERQLESTRQSIEEQRRATEAAATAEAAKIVSEARRDADAQAAAIVAQARRQAEVEVQRAQAAQRDLLLAESRLAALRAELRRAIEPQAETDSEDGAAGGAEKAVNTTSIP